MEPPSSQAGQISPRAAAMAQSGGAGEDLGGAMEDTQPVGSTSKVPYGSTQASAGAPHSPTSAESLPPVRADDQDINPSSAAGEQMQDSADQRDRSRSPSTPSPILSSLKGKGRALDPHQASALPPLLQPRQVQSPRAIVLPDPFERSEMERLRVENDLLKKQLDVLAKKRNMLYPSGLALLETEQSRATRPEQANLELQHMHRMLRTSEAQRKRLEKELRYLRSYLLSSVEPYRLPTPESENGEIEDIHAVTTGTTEIARHTMESFRGNHDFAEASPRRESRRPSRRKQTMGDAETEHLLLASARLTRLRKVVDLHPQSGISHLPPARQARASDRGTIAQTQTITGANGVSLTSLDLPPLPLPWPAESHATAPTSSSVSPTHMPMTLPNGLGSPIRTTRVKTEVESPQVNFSNAASIFQGASSSSSTTTNANNVQAPAMRASVSATSSGKGGNGERKIGRPLGSPNKTKLVSINTTAAVRRRASASGTRGKGRPIAGSASSSVHPYSGRSHTTRGNSHDPNASVDELLLAAAQTLYGENKDTDMEVDAVGDEVWDRDDTLAGASSSPKHAPYPPLATSAAVPFPPATPASLEGPDMTRFPNIVSTPPISGLPATPGRARTTLQSGQQAAVAVVPPQTPNTLARNERSALDVLAEEAASASKGPPTSSSSRNNIESLSGSARNLAQEMEMAREELPMNSFNGFTATTKNEYSDTDKNLHHHRSNQHQYQYTLGEAFEPDYQGNNFDPLNSTRAAVEEREEEPEEVLPPPMTIAEQLAQGVDMSHPLIDPEDIQAGMTPAAALAKKSRSPYIKWTIEEDEQLILGVAEHGTKWEAVARMIPSRSYHQCRQRWLRGLKSGDALPANMQYLKPKIDAAVQAYEQARPGAPKKVE